jgi:predicted transcriptional regulator
MASETVRIKPGTHAKLKELAGELGKSMPEVLAAAIDGLYRQRFLEDCNRAYARLKANPKAWREELAQRKAWDATLADGLENENHEPARKRRNVVRRPRPSSRS